MEDHVLVLWVSHSRSLLTRPSAMHSSTAMFPVRSGQIESRFQGDFWAGLFHRCCVCSCQEEDTGGHCWSHNSSGLENGHVRILLFLPPLLARWGDCSAVTLRYLSTGKSCPLLGSFQNKSSGSPASSSLSHPWGSLLICLFLEKLWAQGWRCFWRSGIHGSWHPCCYSSAGLQPMPAPEVVAMSSCTTSLWPVPSHSWPGAVVLQTPSVSARQASSPQCSEDPCPFSRGGNLGATVWELGTLIVPRLVTVSGPFQWTKVVCLFVCLTESVVNLYCF